MAESREGKDRMRGEVNCLRCNATMHYLKDEKIQLGQTGWLLGDLPNLWAGAMEVAIYVCPNCGKIELFQTELEEARDRMAQKQCPRCGKRHDLDDPKCPFCKYDYVHKE